jgi:hypothetical protein
MDGPFSGPLAKSVELPRVNTKDLHSQVSLESISSSLFDRLFSTAARSGSRYSLTDGGKFLGGQLKVIAAGDPLCTLPALSAADEVIHAAVKPSAPRPGHV